MLIRHWDFLKYGLPISPLSASQLAIRTTESIEADHLKDEIDVKASTKSVWDKLKIASSGGTQKVEERYVPSLAADPFTEEDLENFVREENRNIIGETYQSEGSVFKYVEGSRGSRTHVDRTGSVTISVVLGATYIPIVGRLELKFESFSV